MQILPDTLNRWAALTGLQRIVIGALWLLAILTLGGGFAAAMSSQDVALGLVAVGTLLASIILAITHLSWFFTRKHFP